MTPAPIINVGRNIAANPEKDFIEYFPNIAALLQANRTRPWNPKVTRFGTWDQYITTDRDKDFCGVSTYQEAEQLITRGDIKLSKKILKVKASGRAARDTARDLPKPTLTRSQAGYYANVPAYLQGDPRSMLTITQQQVRGRIISLYVSISVNYRVDKTRITDCALKIAGAVRAIERRGIRVAFSVVSAATDILGTGATIGIAVPVKKATAPLNITSILTATTPYFHRLISFTARYKTPAPVSNKWQRYLGIPINNPRDYIKLKPTDRAIHILDVEPLTETDIIALLIEQ